MAASELEDLVRSVPHQSSTVEMAGRDSALASRKYYGWVIVVVAAWAMVATLPGRTHGLGMITERLLSDPQFGLTRESYAAMNFWATILGASFCLPCGWMIDRYGLRVTLFVTLAGLIAAVWGMVWVSSSTDLFVLLLLSRGFGQSALSTVSIAMVGQWFRGKSTFPMAVYTLLLSLGFAQAFPWAGGYAKQNWRVLWGTLGGILAASLPFAVWLARNPPADSSFKVALNDEGTGDRAATQPLPGCTLIQALRTPAFWLFGCGISLISFQSSGMSLFQQMILSEQGFDDSTYYVLLGFTGYVALAVKLPIGWLGQLIPLNRLWAIGFFLTAGCTLLFPWITHDGTSVTWHAMPRGGALWLSGYAVGMGLAGTITTVLFFAIWGDVFGPRHLGRIQAVAQMLTVLASASGPVVFAHCHTLFASFRPMFLPIAILELAIAVWASCLAVPRFDATAASNVQLPANRGEDT